MSPRLKTALLLGASVALGGGLLWLALRGVEFQAVGDALRTADYRWLGPLVLVTTLAHGLRAWRWQLLLDTLPGEDGAPPAPVTFRTAFYSVMIGYMVNYAAPRLGELARAANLSSRTRFRFSAVLGTVVAERVLDVLALLVAMATVGLLFRARLAGVVDVFGRNTRATLDSLPVAVLLGASALGLLGVLGGWVLWRRAVRRSAVGPKSRLAGLAVAFRDGLASALRVQRRGALFLSTVSIWACYLLMADFPLRMLGITETFGLGLMDSWALMVVGAVGMSVPSPGGTGSFHYATVQTLVHLLGVAPAPAATYALLTHAAQLVFLCGVGFACLLAQGTSVGALRRAAASARAEAAPLAEAPAGA